MQLSAPASATLTIVLDTTELKETPRLEGGLIGLVLTASRLGRVHVALPQVVLDEFKRHQRRRIEEAIKKIDEGARSLEIVSGRANSSTSYTVNDLYAEWLNHIEPRLTSAKAKILPLPEVSHEALLARDLGERKPFDDGRGYRDALIWETVLACALEPRNGTVVFVTRNTRDFADKDALHPHLQDDLRERDLPATRLHLACGLKAALETYVQDMLPPSDKELAATLERDVVDHINLRRWLLDSLPSAMADLPPAITTTTSGQVVVRRVADVESLKVTSAWRLDAHTVHVALNARLRVDMTPLATPYIADVLHAPDNNAFIEKVVGNLVGYHLAVDTLKNRQVDLCIEVTFDARGNGSNVDVRGLRIVDDARPLPGPLALLHT